MTKSSGEEVYANAFQFKPFVKDEDHEKLRDFLYKYSFNLTEAYEYLFLLTQCNEIEARTKSELFYRIYGMSLQCLALCVRKITDNSSERSVRKLIDLAVKPELAAQHKENIEVIYRHYDKFLNKFVVHQDVPSIHEGIAFFPDANVINDDLRELREFYLTLADEICTGYINVTGEGHYYGFDLHKLVED